MSSNVKERIYKFDNIKFLSIMLVVVGHIVERYIGESDMFKSLFIFIYSFHMPLFIFLSGLFQKRFSDTNKLNINKVAFYITLGVLLKIYVHICRIIAGKDPVFNMFGDSNISWYMFVLAMFMVAAYIVRKIHPAIVLPVSIAIACVCGYFNFIDDTLYLSRFFVYFPIYILGYYMTPQLIIKIEKNLVVKAVSGLSMLFYFVLCFRNVDAVYKLRRLMTGRNPYSSLPFENCGAQHRLLCYAIAIVLCMAVFCFIPNVKIPLISKMGANTLAVYFWHNPLLDLLSATPFFTIILSLGDPLYKVILLFFGVILTFVLSFNIFMVPFKYLSKLIDKLKPVWCYVLIFAPFVISLIAMYKEIPQYCSYLINKAKNVFS